MHVWRISRDPNDIERHEMAEGVGHALLAPVVANIFEALGVGASLWEHGVEWKVIHAEAPATHFEYEHGKETERFEYNERSFARVLRKKESVLAEHAGFSDLFVPVVIRREVAAILVVGPFLLKHPTGSEIVERWRWLTGRQAHPADPEFAAYFSTTLATLTLDTGRLRTFQQLLECFAQLLAGAGRADQLTNQAEALGAELKAARFTQRAWQAVRDMVDERFSKRWFAAGSEAQLRRVGLGRVPDAVLVGLCKGREETPEPVDEAVRRHAFQESAVTLSQKLGNLIAGQVGDHGVVFLSGGSGSIHAREQRLLEVAQRATVVARQKFGLSLHCGVGVGARTALLSRTYASALGAAEAALSSGKRCVVAGTDLRTDSHSLRELRRELGRAVEESPGVLQQQFERYLEAVAVRTGRRLESARGPLEAGFDRLTESLLESGTLDEKSYAALTAVLDRAAGDARTLSELFAAYRRGVIDIFEAITKPTLARRDRNLRRAVDYIQQHYDKPLRLEGVARLSGFSPDYFSKLFKRREKKSFELYVRGLRIERAKQLLTSTELSVARVAELSGFNSVQYFATVFRGAAGVSALEYRRGGSQAGRESRAEKRKKKNGKSQIRRRRTH